MTKRALISAVTTLVLISLAVLLYRGCTRSIDVVPRIVDDHVVFDIPTRNIDKIYGLSVEDESGNKIWSFSDATMGHYAGGVVYGALPEGSGVHAGVGQTYPSDKQPPFDIRGRTVTVVVPYGYDFVVPSSATFRKTVRIPK
ncbi:MAG TPA: hypothetical protein VGG61_12620 [Gemmataceae bacterium]|jgi:hypothetical protein